jgi:hypothetical protein
MPNSRARDAAGRLPPSNNWTASRLNSGVNCLRVPIGHLLGESWPRFKVSVKSGPPQYVPSGGLDLILLVVLVLALTGRLGRPAH